ncbi:MAG TPA: adenylate/guanylate cyclase domain-containing protein [Chitinophagaceae bacterium]|nr:adenylate/guanylate cyclase domain-containing protein [Chitinophagaceae bacterium]
MFSKRKAYYFLISFLFFSLIAPGQDQKLADSLARIYKKGDLNDTSKLELLRNLSFNEITDLKLSLTYAEELISLSEALGNDIYLHRGYLQKGNKKLLLGDLDEALAAFFKSAEIASRADYAKGEGTAYNAIADTYSILNNHDNASLYYRKAIYTLRKSGADPVTIASAILNAGDEFQKRKLYDSALIYFREAGLIFEKTDNATGKAYTLGNMGMVYASKGEYNLALKNINDAINMLEKLEDYPPICDYLISLSDMYSGKGDTEMAIDYAQRSLKFAKQYGFKDEITDANHRLSELYEKTGRLDLSFKYYKDYIAYRDSVNDINAVQKMADLRTNFEVSQKQVEVDLLNQQKKNQQIIVIATIIALGLILLLLFGVYQRYKFMRESNKIIEAEKKRSDSLLLNILPEETAQELKKSGKVLAKKFESVTVMFTDFKSFTHYATNLPPEILVETIDYYFSKFDQIIEKYGLEKIKTVGDSYMCAGGLPFPSADHAHKTVQAALEIERFISETKKDATSNVIGLDIRIGINSGPVVAGVVGTKKFAYDIWGDTVNIASRMESNSEPGRINISANTFELVKDAFACDYRGEISVKNRGTMKMYFVNHAI